MGKTWIKKAQHGKKYNERFVISCVGKKQLPQMPNTYSGAHWGIHQNETKKWMRRIREETLCRRPKEPIEKAYVHFTRCSTREPDYDNLVAGFKRVLDALIKCGLIVDDSPKHLVSKYTWEKAKRPNMFIEIHIKELEK